MKDEGWVCVCVCHVSLCVLTHARNLTPSLFLTHTKRKPGHNLGTAEVEAALTEHPAVAEAAVVGISHDVKGAWRVCCVVLYFDRCVWCVPVCLSVVNE